MEYLADKIRNVCILGHLGSGKTSLGESILYTTKAIDKKGEVEKKTTVSDYLPEEQSRLTSTNASLLPVYYNDHKFNFIDLPGSEEFVNDLLNSLSVVKGAILVVDASKGVEVGTERYFRELKSRKIPTIIFVNKMDKENVKFDALLEDIREKLSKTVAPFCYPIGKKEDFEGFVNVVDMKARIYNGKECVDAEIYEEKLPKIDELHGLIMESVAESSEELLEKYLGGEELTTEEVHQGLRTGVLDGSITPLIVGSSVKNIGVHTLLNMLIEYLPKPNDLKDMVGLDQTGNPVSRKTVDDEPFSAYVFKTNFDLFLGTISFFKVFSGTVEAGSEVYIPALGRTEKLGNLYVQCGKTQKQVQKLHAGDIGVVNKVNDLLTGHTLCDKRAVVTYPSVEVPNPTMYFAITPKNKNDEDKISGAFQKLNLEDQSFAIQRNKETNQLLIGGQGKTHIDYILEKLKNMFKVDVDILEQKICYRETIKAKAAAEGRYIKQTGGGGQYGVVHIEFEPCDEKFVFAERVFGGAVPKNYFPAVEKGLVEALEVGPLAGFPVINVKATLFDGKYHDVDSSELSFKMAAIMAFRKACEENNIKSTMLEPIIKLSIIVKDEYVGDVMGDMTKRRGRVTGMNPLEGGLQEIQAEAPEAEITKYTIDLKAMTQGSGYFSREFLRYDEVPSHIIPKIIEQYKK